MAGAKPTIKSFACTACGAPVSVRGLGQTTTAACASCGSLLDITDPRYRIIQKFQREEKKIPIPLGVRGTFFGTQYETIGYLTKTDATKEYQWGEYLLFNPYQGFAWLVISDGHWTFLKTTKEAVGDPEKRVIWYKRKRFRRFLVDKPSVEYVIGEFYWRVGVGDTVKSVDYIAPPFLLSCELSSDEIVWSFGEYLSSEEIEEAFKLEDRLYPSTGVGAIQPNPWWRRVFYSTPVFALAALLAVLIHAAYSPSETGEIFRGRYSYKPTASVSPIYSQQFEVRKETTNLAVALSAPVNNSWLDVDLELINLATNEVQDQSMEVAYYHGADSDGSWSEGSTNEEYYFLGVEPGNYYISITPSADPQILLDLPYTIAISQGVRGDGNLVIALLLLLIVPFGCFLLASSMEKKRWEQSSEVSHD